MFFPNGSSAHLDGIWPRVLEDLTANGHTVLKFLRAFSNLAIVILDGKVPSKLRPHVFGAELIALKKPNEGFILSLLAILSSKCPQNVPDTLASNHFIRHTEVDR